MSLSKFAHANAAFLDDYRSQVFETYAAVGNLNVRTQANSNKSKNTKAKTKKISFQKVDVMAEPFNGSNIQEIETSFGNIMASYVPSQKTNQQHQSAQ